MPARDINVTGSVGSLERPYLKNERIQLAGRDSIVMVSASAQGEETKGIILVYGDAEDGFRFYDRLDGDRFVRDAVAAGYTVASVVSDAYDHPGDTVAWNVDFSNRESNLDLLRTKKAIAKLLLREGASDLPVYLLGIGGRGRSLLCWREKKGLLQSPMLLLR